MVKNQSNKVTVTLNKKNADKMVKLAKDKQTNVSLEVNKIISQLEFEDKINVVLSIPKETIIKGEVGKWVRDRSYSIDSMLKY